MSNRKEQILQQTFLLLSQSEFSAISMSEIAAKVGVSKTALYRHFPNKEALFASLQSYFFDEIADCLRGFDFAIFNHSAKETLPAKKELFYRMFKFFAAKSEYLFYLILSYSSSSDFEEVFITSMQERGVPLTGERRMHNLDPEKLDQYIHFLYILATAVYFINEKQQSNPDLDTEVFARKMCAFIFNGWKGLQSITFERAAVLNKEGLIKTEELPEENKIFTALSKVIQEQGFSGVTIERLSTELGMAKSSLYCYFDNKHQMITEFIVGEIAHFVKLLRSRYNSAQNTSEAVYVQLQMVISYLLQRQSIIPLFDWLRRRGMVMRGKLREVYTDNEYLHDIYDNMPELGFEISNFSIVGWISTLPVSIVVQCRFHNFTDEQLFAAIRRVYDYMKDGIT